MKCTQCGCTDFLDAKEVRSFVYVINSDGGAGSDSPELQLVTKEHIKNKDNLYGRIVEREQTVYTDRGSLQAFVCKKCGHVEFFCNTYLLKEQEEQRKIREEQERLANNERIEKEIAENNSKIEELKAKATDENITVKEQRTLLEEIECLKKKNKSLKDQIR